MIGDRHSRQLGLVLGFFLGASSGLQAKPMNPEFFQALADLEELEELPPPHPGFGGGGENPPPSPPPSPVLVPQDQWQYQTPPQQPNPNFQPHMQQPHPGFGEGGGNSPQPAVLVLVPQNVWQYTTPNQPIPHLTPQAPSRKRAREAELTATPIPPINESLSHSLSNDDQGSVNTSTEAQAAAPVSGLFFPQVFMFPNPGTSQNSSNSASSSNEPSTVDDTTSESTSNNGSSGTPERQE